jgi:hypothetical protein
MTDWRIPLLTAVTLNRKPSCCISVDDAQRFQFALETYQVGHEIELPQPSLACLHEAAIYSRDFIVLTSRQQIVFESALSNTEILESNGILDKIFWPQPQQKRGPHCLLAHPWAHAYYHWVIEILPRLSLMEQWPGFSDLSFVVPEQLTGFQDDSLELAGISEQKRMRFGGDGFCFERLFFPELLAPPGNPSPHAVSWLRSRFMPGIDVKSPEKRLLYLSRRDAPQRRLLNEEEITAFLMTIGFEVVCAGDLSFREQVALFRNASFVIAPHGAALTNMVFAPPGATLIEFFGQNYINGCFWALANICGHEHAFITGQSIGLDYMISLNDLKSLLRKLEKL